MVGFKIGRRCPMRRHEAVTARAVHAGCRDVRTRVVFLRFVVTDRPVYRHRYRYVERGSPAAAPTVGTQAVTGLTGTFLPASR